MQTKHRQAPSLNDEFSTTLFADDLSEDVLQMRQAEANNYQVYVCILLRRRQALISF